MDIKKSITLNSLYEMIDKNLSFDGKDPAESVLPSLNGGRLKM